MIYAASAYVLFCLAVFAFQRKLMYPSMREAKVALSDAGFSDRQARNVSVTTADGIRIGAWHVLPQSAWATRAEPPKDPPDFDAELNKGPVTLFFHGNGGHRGHRGELYDQLAAWGRHAVSIDYRGYGDSEGSPTEKGLAEDARAIWSWLVQTKGVDPKRIVLHGESLGCAVAIRLASELCESGTPPAGMILEAPFTSMTDAAASMYWFLPARLMVLDTFPSAKRIGNVSCPVIILHGHLDHVVPFEHGKKIFELAPEGAKSGVPKRMIEFPEARHVDMRVTDSAKYEQALMDFMKEIEQKVE